MLIKALIIGYYKEIGILEKELLKKKLKKEIENQKLMYVLQNRRKIK